MSKDQQSVVKVLSFRCVGLRHVADIVPSQATDQSLNLIFQLLCTSHVGEMEDPSSMELARAPLSRCTLHWVAPGKSIYHAQVDHD